MTNPERPWCLWWRCLRTCRRRYRRSSRSQSPRSEYRPCRYSSYGWVRPGERPETMTRREWASPAVGINPESAITRANRIRFTSSSFFIKFIIRCLLRPVTRLRGSIFKKNLSSTPDWRILPRSGDGQLASATTQMTMPSTINQINHQADDHPDDQSEPGVFR